MSIVNFSIPQVLEKRVDETIRQKGFASKAEFFRFAAVHFIDLLDKPVTSEEERFHFLTKSIKKMISKQYRGRTMPSIQEQLADV